MCIITNLPECIINMVQYNLSNLFIYTKEGRSKPGVMTLFPFFPFQYIFKKYKDIKVYKRPTN